MKILVIVESINVDDSSGSKVNVALIHNLIKSGFQIKVLHYSHKQIKIDGVDAELIIENKWSLLFLLSRLVRFFQRTTKININHKLEGFFGFSFTHSNDTKSIEKAIRNHQNFQYDLILTLSKGGSFRPHRAMLRFPKLYHKWLAYIHDPYPFHMYPRPYDWVETSYKQKEKLMFSIIENAKYIAFPSLLLKEWMESYFPKILSKSIIIPHQIFNSSLKSELPEYFNKDEFNLLHAGNLLQQRNPSFLLEAFQNFLEQNIDAQTNAKLFLIGSNSAHHELLKKYRETKNIIIKDYVQYNDIQFVESQTTANILLEAVSENSPFLPGKFPNLIISNRPILALSPHHSEVRRLLGENYPYWSKANDVGSIQKNITELYINWKKDPKQLNLNRKDLEDYLSPSYLKNAFLNLTNL